MVDTGKYLHEELSRRVIGAAIEVHRCLGPGLLESAYEVCLADELTRREVAFERQVPLPVVFKGRTLDCGYRMDFVVDDRIIVELKCVEKVIAIHEAQLITYLKLAQIEVGLIINFCVPVLKEGIVRRALTPKQEIITTDQIHTGVTVPTQLPSSAASASLR